METAIAFLGGVVFTALAVYIRDKRRVDARDTELAAMLGVDTGAGAMERLRWLRAKGRLPKSMRGPRKKKDEQGVLSLGGAS